MIHRKNKARGARLTARHKLNSATIHGALVIAGIVALLIGSWPVFLVVLAVLVATAIHSGDIRIGPRRR
jgi:hypothetical protein